MRAFVALLALAAAACSRSEVAQRCDAFRDHVVACAGKSADVVSRAPIARYCEVAQNEPRSQPGKPPSLADTSRAALDACMPISDCAALNACLAKHGCTVMMRSPDDPDPSFDCIGP